MNEPMLRRYTFKLYPNAAQAAALREQAAMCAELWNGLLESRETTTRRDGEVFRFDPRAINRWDIDDELTAIDARSALNPRDDKRRLYTAADEARRIALFRRLRARIKDARQGGKAPTAFDQGRDITAMRAECPEWAAMSRGAQERIADMLDLAFKAFFKRAKSGQPGGYPRFKRVRKAGVIVADSIHLREPIKSRWTFAPSQGAETAHSGPARKSKPNGDAQGSPRARGEEGRVGAWRPLRRESPRARGEEGRVGSARHSARPSPRARGEEGSRSSSSVALDWSPRARGEEGGRAIMSEWAREPPRARGEEGDIRRCQSNSSTFVGDEDGANTGSNWRLRLRNIPGAIKARGRFPVAPLSHKTADIRFANGAWWFSICVEIERARAHGYQDIKVDFDLIDSFASVTDANGECLAGLSDPFSTGGKGESSRDEQDLHKGSCGEPANAGERQGPRLRGRARPPCGEPANAGERQAARGPAHHGTCGEPANAGERQGPIRLRRLATTCGEPANAGERQDCRRPPPTIRPCDEPENAGGWKDILKSNRDRRFRKFSYRWRRETARIAKLEARQARQRREALHRWTTRVVAHASRLDLTAPPQQALQSGRGDADRPGAEVKTIAALNRRVLSQSPGAAIQMLEYKAAEAGVACDVKYLEDHEITVGGDLRAGAIAQRSAKRTIRREKRKANV